MYRYLAYVFTAVFLTIGAAQAQSIYTMPIGTEVETKVRFARSDVPLPPGKWILAAASESQSRNIDGSMTARLPVATLVSIRNNTLVGLVSLFGTAQTENLQWIRDRECERTDLLFVDADRNFNMADQFCMRVSHSMRTWVAPNGADENTQQLYAYLRDAKIVRATTLLGTVVRIVRYGEFLRVGYEILPSAFGGPATRNNSPTTSEWHVDLIGANPAHRRFADAWVDWSKAITPQVKAGFGRTLQGYTPAAINGFDPATPRPATPVSGDFRAPAVGTRFVTKNGHFEVVKTESMSITTMNAGKSGTTWSAGLLPLDSNAKFDRGAIESLFPLSVGKKARFRQEAASSTNAWDQSLEIVRTEALEIDGKSYTTFVIEGRTEAVGPGMNEFIRKRTLHYAPELGWLLKMQEEQHAGPPQRMNSWEVVRIIPPGG